jgi:zinc D-Ala-D-Ala carboxypeptidase
MHNLKLTRSFSLAEFIQSDTAERRGIINIPTATPLLSIERHLAPGLQRIRDLLGVPVIISSGYRSPTLNAAVGGSRNSQHVRGEAVDFRAPAFGTPLDVCRQIVKFKELVGFDQLIEEGNWVHVSFVDRDPRGQVLTATFSNGRATYSQGLRA